MVNFLMENSIAQALQNNTISCGWVPSSCSLVQSTIIHLFVHNSNITFPSPPCKSKWLLFNIFPHKALYVFLAFYHTKYVLSLW